MSDLFYLSPEQFDRIKRHLPYPHGAPRVDDVRVISGIIFVLKRGLQWRDAPKEYGQHKTLYTRFIRWSRKGIFNKIFAALVEESGKPFNPRYRTNERWPELKAPCRMRW